MEYLRGSPPGTRVREIVDRGDIYTTSLSLSEVVGHVAKSDQNAGIAARAIQTLSEIVNLDNELALAAAKRFARMKKSRGSNTMAQAYLIEAAKKLGAEIVTGDKTLVSGRKISIF